jgi:tetratricopeptide (TPR) repeat protein
MTAAFTVATEATSMDIRSYVFAISAAVALCAAPLSVAQARPQEQKPLRQDAKVAQLPVKAADAKVLKSQLYAAATKLGAKGKYQRAAQQLDQVVARFPTSPVALYTRALAHHNLGNDDLAVRDTTKAIALDPGSANSYFVRGAALQSKGEFESALRDYVQVVSLVPDHESAYLAMGTAYFSVGSYERAVASLDKAIELNGAEPTYFLLRGLSNREAGKADKAIADLNEALRLDPKNEQATALLDEMQPKT